MFNFIFVLLSIIVLLIFIFSIAIIKLRSIRDDINLRWYNLLDKLQYRQDLVPNLIETVRLFIPEKELSKYDELIGEAIAHRAHAAKNAQPGADKIIQEHDLSAHIKKLIDLGAKYESLGQSTNYLELKKEIADIRDEIEKLSNDYNNKVRQHNHLLKNKFYTFPAKLLNYTRKQIFEFE